MHHDHNPLLVILSVLIAIFASYTSLDLANSLSVSKGRARAIWLIGGSMAMGVGIWSMHFIAMLAFSLPGIDIYYDVPLLFLSILVAIIASALALQIVSGKVPTTKAYVAGSLTMGAAIAGMHYIGIWSMRMAANIHWNMTLVFASITIAIVASFAALMIAFKLRNDLTVKGFLFRGAGGIVMGFAIAGMHYTAMAAMHFTRNKGFILSSQDVLATDGLAAAVIIGTILILGIALTGSNVERTLTKKNEGIRLRDEFLSIASHELKTPLTSVKLQTELLIRQFKKENVDKEKAEGMLKNSLSSLNRMIHLIDEMLDISRITSGRLVLDKSNSDMGELIHNVVETYRPHFEEKKNIITFERCKAMGIFDPHRVEQIVTNLISNAFKYGNDKPVVVKLKCDENFITLIVTDQGMGIPKQFQNKIFERFERVGEGKEISGLGLGLFIVKQLVDAHRGKIWVESEPGKGSSFFVKLPVS